MCAHVTDNERKQALPSFVGKKVHQSAIKHASQVINIAVHHDMVLFMLLDASLMSYEMKRKKYGT
jgi:hypothetical protein